jgi:hypothetical protein
MTLIIGTVHAHNPAYCLIFPVLINARASANPLAYLSVTVENRDISEKENHEMH